MTIVISDMWNHTECHGFCSVIIHFNFLKGVNLCSCSSWDFHDKLTCINLVIYDKKIFHSKHLTLVVNGYFCYIYNAKKPEPVQTYMVQSTWKANQIALFSSLEL